MGSPPDPVTLRGKRDNGRLDILFPFNPGNGRSVEKLTLTAPDAQPSWVSSSCRKALGHLNISPHQAPRTALMATINSTEHRRWTLCPFGASDCPSGLCAVDILTGASFCTEDRDQCPRHRELIVDLNYDSVCVLWVAATPEVVINEVLYDELWIKTCSGCTEPEHHPRWCRARRREWLKRRPTARLPHGDDRGGWLLCHRAPRGGVLDRRQRRHAHGLGGLPNGPDSLQLQYAGQTLDAPAYGTFSARRPLQARVRPPSMSRSVRASSASTRGRHRR